MLQILFEKQRKMWQTGIDKGEKMLQIYGKNERKMLQEALKYFGKMLI